MLDASEVKSLAKGGETLTVEFKQDSNDHPIHSSTLLRAVVGLSNNDAGGGTLLVGVDNDGTISGIGSRSTNLQHRDGARLSAYLRNKTTPPVAVEAGFVDIDEATVAVIRVGQPDEPVGSEGLYVRRRLKQDGTPEVIPYSLPEMANRRRLFFDQDYAGVPIPAATLDDLDHGEFDKYRARAARGPEPNLAELNDSELLRALGLGVFDSDAIVTAGALLLFGRPSSIERHLPTAEVVFSALQGTLLASSEIGYWPLLSAADHLVAQVMDALRRRAAPEAELTIGAQRVSLPAITNATLREAVANALVHRDYAMAGATTVVVSDDGCQITNPGGLPKGVSLANMMEETRPRSRLLADGFKRAGYVERTGRGVPLMYMDQIRNGQAAPDYSGTTGDQVCVQFRATRADIEMALFLRTWETQGRPVLGARDMQTLRAIRDLRDPTALELAERLWLNPDDARKAASHLAELGCVEARGRGSGRYYVLTSLIGQLTGYAQGYVFDDSDTLFEKRVLDATKHLPKLTRKHVIDLCGMTPQAATRLLQRLTSEGKLLKRGTKRGTYYVAATTQSREERP